MAETYSRLLGWEVWNFMSIKHAKVEFDDTNIINIKGYNDSGKSAMLRALDVLFYNIKPQKQTDFIHDGETYFRVVAYFNDGVSILRDKYANGQSLYELYKDGQTLFTTKKGTTLLKVTEVPKPIADYLGLLTWEKTNINSRSCWENQLLVETKGSENYQMLNTILKSEEIAVAGNLLNTDKNEKIAKINSKENELSAISKVVSTYHPITAEDIADLKALDSQIDLSNANLGTLTTIKQSNDAIKTIHITPELESIDASKLSGIEHIKALKKAWDNIPLPMAEPLDKIDTAQFCHIMALKAMKVELEGLKADTEELTPVGSEVIGMLNAYKNYKVMCDEIARIDDEISKAKTEMDNIAKSLAENNIHAVRCTNCGELILDDMAHQHLEG